MISIGRGSCETSQHSTSRTLVIGAGAGLMAVRIRRTSTVWWTARAGSQATVGMKAQQVVWRSGLGHRLQRLRSPGDPQGETLHQDAVMRHMLVQSLGGGGRVASCLMRATISVRLGSR